MAHAKKELREEARRLRAEGWSVGGIARQLGVSRSSVSVWARDIQLTEAQIETIQERKKHYFAQSTGARKNREIYLDKRRAYQQIGRERAREGRPLHLIGCMLHWAEGAKDKNSVVFVNSDPNMMLLFVRFLREEMQIEDAAMAIRVHCHTKDVEEIERIKNYWLTLLQLPPESYKQTYYKVGSDTRKNSLVNGVCRLTVYRTELVQHIYGAIQEYGGFDNPAWLF